MTFLEKLACRSKNGGELFSGFIPVVRKVENNRTLVQLENEALAVERTEFAHRNETDVVCLCLGHETRLIKLT